MASCPLIGLIHTIGKGRLSGIACGMNGEMEMKCNVGGVDRTARIVLGALIVLAGVVTGSWLGAIGLVLVGTGLASRCPLYMPFKLSTCGTATRQTDK